MSITNIMNIEQKFINDMDITDLKEHCYNKALRYYELDNITDTINHILYTNDKLELENISNNGAWFTIKKELNQNDLKELLTIMKQYELDYIGYQLGAWFNTYRIDLKYDNELIIKDIGNDLKEITRIGFRYR